MKNKTTKMKRILKVSQRVNKGTKVLVQLYIKISSRKYKVNSNNFKQKILCFHNRKKIR
jgi:hypothetical protein